MNGNSKIICAWVDAEASWPWRPWGMIGFLPAGIAGALTAHYVIRKLYGKFGANS